jgi:very-short-patch-repair endonuclease
VDKDTIKYISADFAYHNKIIEFDGDYWHSRPGVSKRDKIKDNILISMGYEVLRVKEGDWISSPLTTLKKCLEFLCIKI